MSSEDENLREIQKKLKSIEKRVKNIEKGSLSDTEHQLFFGVIISLVILFLTIDPKQIADFFTNVGFVEADAMEIATLIKTWGAILTFSSAIIRYYSALVKDDIKKSQKTRLASIALVVMGFELFLFFPVMNINLPLPEQISLLNLPLKIFILLIIYRFIAYFLEKKLLSFYASKKLILKKDINPIVSKAFVSSMRAAYIAVVIAFTVYFFLQSYAVEVFLGFFVIGFLLLVLPDIKEIRKTLS